MAACSSSPSGSGVLPAVPAGLSAPSGTTVLVVLPGWGVVGFPSSNALSSLIVVGHWPKAPSISPSLKQQQHKRQRRYTITAPTSSERALCNSLCNSLCNTRSTSRTSSWQKGSHYPSAQHSRQSTTDTAQHSRQGRGWLTICATWLSHLAC